MLGNIMDFPQEKECELDQEAATNPLSPDLIFPCDDARSYPRLTLE